MHICYLSDAGNVHTHRWARHFVERGNRVTVCSFRDSAIEGVEVVPIKQAVRYPSLNYLLAALPLRQALRRLKPDILHAHYATSYGMIGAVSGLHPYVVTAWGSDVLVSPERSLAYRLLLRYVFRCADLVTSMANHMTTHMLRRGYVGSEKVITLPFGVDTGRFNPTGRQPHHAHPAPVVVSTRHLSEIYDIQTLISAIPFVIRDLPSTRFTIAGEGNLLADLQSLAAKSGVSDRTDFVGRVHHALMPELLRGADVFISTARSDGNNISLNEAMACGAFPIATDIPANEEWIVHGENGLLFPCGDSETLARQILQALRDADLRERAARQNWLIVNERASWQVSMTKIENEYQRLMAARI